MLVNYHFYLEWRNGVYNDCDNDKIIEFMCPICLRVQSSMRTIQLTVLYVCEFHIILILGNGEIINRLIIKKTAMFKKYFVVKFVFIFRCN